MVGHGKAPRISQLTLGSWCSSDATVSEAVGAVDSATGGNLMNVTNDQNTYFTSKGYSESCRSNCCSHTVAFGQDHSKYQCLFLQKFFF